MLSFLGHMIVGVTDNIMVGHYDTSQFAACVFANSIFIILFIFGIGFTNGLTPLIGEANGAKKYSLIRAYLKNSVVLNTAISFVLLILCFVLSSQFDAMGQTESVVQYARPFFGALSVSIVPVLIFLTLKQFTDGTQNTKPAMVVTIASDVVNIALNYILIYGKFGFPEWGSFGSGVATLVTRVAMLAVFFWYLFSSKEYKHFTEHWWKEPIDSSIIKTILQKSIPVALQSLMEVGAFAFGSIMMGWMGEARLAAHQVVLGIASLTFMMANGLSVATNIRISNLLGEGKLSHIRPAGFTSLALVLLFMGCCAIVFTLFRYQLPYIYTTDANVIAIATPLFLIAALFQVFDGTQVVMLNALRGIQDTTVPTIIAFIGYWVVSLPVGYTLAFTMNLQQYGVWWGYLAGLIVASILLAARFTQQSKQLSLR